MHTVRIKSPHDWTARGALGISRYETHPMFVTMQDGDIDNATRFHTRRRSNGAHDATYGWQRLFFGAAGWVTVYCKAWHVITDVGADNTLAQQPFPNTVQKARNRADQLLAGARRLRDPHLAWGCGGVRAEVQCRWSTSVDQAVEWATVLLDAALNPAVIDVRAIQVPSYVLANERAHANFDRGGGRLGTGRNALSQFQRQGLAFLYSAFGLCDVRDVVLSIMMASDIRNFNEIAFGVPRNERTAVRIAAEAELQASTDAANRARWLRSQGGWRRRGRAGSDGSQGEDEEPSEDERNEDDMDEDDELTAAIGGRRMRKRTDQPVWPGGGAEDARSSSVDSRDDQSEAPRTPPTPEGDGAMNATAASDAMLDATDDDLERLATDIHANLDVRSCTMRRSTALIFYARRATERGRGGFELQSTEFNHVCLKVFNWCIPNTERPTLDINWRSMWRAKT